VISGNSDPMYMIDHWPICQGLQTQSFGFRVLVHGQLCFLQENRIRSSWVHLVYATIAEVQERTQMGNQPTILPDGKDPLDPSEIFVKEVVTMALEKGYNLERLKLEQSVAGPAVSAGVKAMRQSNYLILLTLEKILSRG
jgi:hypothetical protein